MHQCLYLSANITYNTNRSPSSAPKPYKDLSDSNDIAGFHSSDCPTVSQIDQNRSVEVEGQSPLEEDVGELFFGRETDTSETLSHERKFASIRGSKTDRTPTDHHD